MNKTNKKNNKPSVMHRIHLFWHDETYHSTILVYYTNNSKIPTIVFTQCHAIYRISLYYVYAISRNLNYLSTIFFNKLLPDNTKQLFFLFFFTTVSHVNLLHDHAGRICAYICKSHYYWKKKVLKHTYFF